MLKEAVGLVGGVLLFSPLGVPILLHGASGIVVGGAGLFVADAVLNQVGNLIQNQVLKAVPGLSEAAIRAGMKAKRRVSAMTATDTRV